MNERELDFQGAKLALLVPDGLVVLRRDRRLDIPWPGAVDLPGGGRENGETPFECARRETLEELSLEVSESELSFARRFRRDGKGDWFFVAYIEASRLAKVMLGEEGQSWWVDPVAHYLARGDAVPYHQSRLRQALNEIGGRHG